MRTPLSRLLLTAAVALGFEAPEAAAAGAFPYAIESHTLKNGLRIVFVPMESPGLAAYYTAVRTGSRNEVEPGHTGFAHFFEHMMFRGTAANPSFDGRMADFGWHNNAFTSDDQTVYTDFGPSARLLDVVALEADRFRYLSYPEPAFRTEALAVLGEYNKSAAAPWLKLEETLVSTAFTRHTYRHTTLGFLEDIREMPGKYVYSKKFHQRFYRPDNCIVIVAGAFDRAAVQAAIETHYGSWRGRADQPKVPVEPPQTEERRAAVAWASPTLPRAIFAYKVPPATDHRTAAALEVVYAYLFGETGTLHKSLVLEQQIAEPFQAWSQARRDPGLWAVLATAKSPEHLARIEQAVDEAIEALETGGLDASALARIQSNRRAELVLSLEDPEEVASRLAWAVSVTGELDAIDRFMAALDALTPEAVAEVARATLVKTGRTVVTLTHVPTAGAPDAPKGSEK
jgi:zinc protease